MKLQISYKELLYQSPNSIYQESALSVKRNKHDKELFQTSVVNDKYFFSLHQCSNDVSQRL